MATNPAPDPDPNEDSVQTELQRYHEAIAQEFKDANAGASIPTDSRELAEYTKDFFKTHINKFAAQIVFLAECAESESVRLNAAKYGIERALTLDATKPVDELSEIMNSLSSNHQIAPIPRA